MKIAIDGPAGAGKSTVAKKLARELGYVYIDTGAMYRALTWKALQNDINLNDQDALYKLAMDINIHFDNNFSPEQKVICDQQDVTYEIRSPKVNSAVSIVASYSLIRNIMVKQQQEMARTISVVMDGRDIGECVLPDADYKFFVTAGIEERVQRRVDELKNKGYQVDSDLIKKEIALRDENDSHREIGALKILPGSITIDTTKLTIKQVLDKMLSIIKED